MSTFQSFEERHKKLLNVLFLLVLTLGLCLRFYQYLMGRSLWEDEAHLALNISSRDYDGLLKTLDYAQAAPPLFLWTVKTFTLIGGNNAYMLRALPFLASILTLPLFYYILFYLTRSRIAALVGFFPFAVNLAVIYYSSELKPYELDVAAFLLLTYLAITDHRAVAAKRNWWLGIAGCVCMLYSSVAFIVLFCIACYIIINWFKTKKVKKEELGMLMTWGIVLIGYYFLFIYHNPYESQMKQYWSYAFPPLPLFGHEFNQFISNSFHEIAFGYLLYVSDSYGFAWVFLFLVVVAIIHAIYRKQYTLLVFACLPVLIHFTLSVFRIYPFWYRLILYLAPPLMILMASGAFVTATFLARKVHRAAGIVFLLICSWFFTSPSFKQYPLYYREIRPVLDTINKDYSHASLFITTPYTLYKYYNLTGYAKNDRYEGLDWYNKNMSPEAYYLAVGEAGSNYILLHAQDYGVDGFGGVMEDLKKKNLVVREFSYMTYTVSEIKPVDGDNGALLIDYTYFAPDKTFDFNGKKVTAIWNRDVFTKSIPLTTGKYKLSLISKGTPVAGVFPHLVIFVNENKIGELSTPADYSTTDLPFEQKVDGTIVIKIVMDNDAVDDAKKEDRNAFIHSIRISKSE